MIDDIKALIERVKNSIARGKDLINRIKNIKTFNDFKCLIVDLFKPKEKDLPALGTYREEKFDVVGVNYYIDDIMKLTYKNEYWQKNSKTLIAANKSQKKIFRYNFINKPVKLIPEPTNKHDKNAILVQIAGEKVGYISRAENVHVKNILTKRDVKFISSFIFGGQYKIICGEGDIDKGEDNLQITVKVGYK